MVSIVIPVYNVGDYIEECIDSILSQTYKNIEIVIINDGSTDHSEEIIKKYLKCNNNIVYLKKENQGVSKARYDGLMISSGDFILFVDPDDYLDTTCVEKMIRKIKKLDLDIVICGYRSFYENKSKDDEYHGYEFEDKIYSNEEVANMMFNFKVKGVIWDKLFKRDLLIQHKFKFENKKYVEDWFPIFKEIYKSRRISFVNEYLYNYRLREGSAVHKKTMEVTNCYYEAVINIKKYIEENKIHIEKKNENTFSINTFYNLIRNYYLAYDKDKKKVYTSFEKSKYRTVNIHLSQVLAKNEASKATIAKIILWKLKIFHLVYPSGKK